MRLLIGLLLTPCLFSAISTTPVHQAVGTTSITITAAASGNTLVVSVAAFRSQGARTVSSISCTNTTGWTKLVGTSGSGLDVEIWAGYATATSGTTITLSMSGTGSTVVSNATEWSGVLTPPATTGKDGNGNTSTNTGTNPSTGAYSTAAACTGDLILASVGYNGSSNAPSANPSGYSNLTFTNSTTVSALQGNYKVPGTAGAQSASWTIDNVLYITAIIGLFQSAKPCTADMSDTTLSSETVARVGAFTRAASDTSLSAESTARLGGFSRAAADTGLSAETVTSGGSTSKSISVSAVASPSVAMNIGLSREASDAGLSAEVVSRVPGLSRSASDTALSAESVASAGNFSRSPSDNATVSESLSGLSAYLRVDNASVVVSASLQTALGIGRVMSDNVNVSPALQRSALVLARGASDSSLSAAILSRLLVFSRTAGNATLSSITVQADQSGGTGQFNRGVSISAIASPAMSRLLVSSRSVPLDSTVSGTMQQVASMLRAASNDMIVDSSVQKNLGYLRYPAASSVIAPAVIRSMAKTADAYLGFALSVSVISEYHVQPVILPEHRFTLGERKVQTVPAARGTSFAIK